MLFLAVFCGFLAAYQLEHKIEKEIEKEYIHSMVEDLKNDTLSLGNAITRNIIQFRGKDSFLLLTTKREIIKPFAFLLEQDKDAVIGGTID